MLGPDPVLTLHLPRSVAITALAALRKQPLEQVEAAHAALLAALQGAEEQLLMGAIAAKLERPDHG